MNKISRWMLAAAACLTLGVASVAAQEVATASKSEADSKVEGQRKHRGMHRKMARVHGRHGMKHMAEELGLSDAQKTQLKGIHEQQRDKARELRQNESLTKEQKLEQMKTLRESTKTQVQGVLTAEQQTRLTEMKAQKKQRMQERKERWQKRRSEGTTTQQL